MFIKMFYAMLLAIFTHVKSCKRNVFKYL